MVGASVGELLGLLVGALLGLSVGASVVVGAPVVGVYVGTNVVGSTEGLGTSVFGGQVNPFVIPHLSKLQKLGHDIFSCII